MRAYSNYNSIAFVYDTFCQLVFGQKIKNAQIKSLEFILPNSNILIVGGGTGWLLEEISKIHDSGLNITYIDNSSRMIQLSKKRNIAFNTVEFISESIENTNLPHHKYDVILTPFLFDNFSQSKAEFVFKKLDASLKKLGHLLYIDFYISEKSSCMQKTLLKIMYVFFRVTCKIEARELPALFACFSLYELRSVKYYSDSFITAQVYQKII
jgi:ubiquinone/menaquinone biosynthesis C-methylase UbiE